MALSVSETGFKAGRRQTFEESAEIVLHRIFSHGQFYRILTGINDHGKKSHVFPWLSVQCPQFRCPLHIT